jgi:SOS-response transcriptional repressor LexA
MGIQGTVTPAQPGRKQQAFEFIRSYILREGRSPAMGEIANALGVSDTRAKALVKKLAHEKMVRRAAGAQRGISIPGLMEQYIADRLREMGVKMDGDFAGTPLPQGHLPLVAIIEHVPDDN